MRKTVRALIAAAAVSALAVAANAAPCPGRLLASVAPDGVVLAGSRKAVVEAARDGAPLRVGWELGPREAPVLIHWQDARFVTVFEGQVFAQVGDIHGQSPVLGHGHVLLRKEWATWVASIGTDGKMVQRMSDDPEPRELGVVSHWCRAS